MRNLGLIPQLGRSPGEWKGYPLQYSSLENYMDYIVHGVAKSQTGLSKKEKTKSVYADYIFTKYIKGSQHVTVCRFILFF